jgi:uncharacterized protein DUF2796
MHGLMLAAGGLLLAGAALAQQHGGHAHGVAELGVVVEGRRLSLEVDGPLDNFVGFEHAPRNAAERAALDRALELLRDPGRVVALPAAAGCVLVATELLNPFAAAKGGAGRDSHADLTASYEFDCATPAALTPLEVRLFESFPRLRKLRAAVVAPAGQSGAELSKSRASLKLSP